MEAFRHGLTTWGNWVDSEVDTNKTRVFFQGISPSHYKYIFQFLFFSSSFFNIVCSLSFASNNFSFTSNLFSCQILID